MENKRPLLVCHTVGVRITGNSEASTGTSDTAEDDKVNPSQLPAETVAENNECGEKEYWDIDAKLYDGDDFLTWAHLDGEDLKLGGMKGWIKG